MTNPKLKWVKEMPEPVGSETQPSWKVRLAPLVDRPGRVARVWEYASENAASGAVSMLRHRKLVIPDPEGEWEFRAVGSDVYACYQGGGT